MWTRNENDLEKQSLLGGNENHNSLALSKTSQKIIQKQQTIAKIQKQLHRLNVAHNKRIGKTGVCGATVLALLALLTVAIKKAYQFKIESSKYYDVGTAYAKQWNDIWTSQQAVMAPNTLIKCGEYYGPIWGKNWCSDGVSYSNSTLDYYASQSPDIADIIKTCWPIGCEYAMGCCANYHQKGEDADLNFASAIVLGIVFACALILAVIGVFDQLILDDKRLTGYFEPVELDELNHTSQELNLSIPQTAKVSQLRHLYKEALNQEQVYFRDRRNLRMILWSQRELGSVANVFFNKLHANIPAVNNENNNNAQQFKPTRFEQEFVKSLYDHVLGRCEDDKNVEDEIKTPRLK